MNRKPKYVSVRRDTPAHTQFREKFGGDTPWPARRSRAQLVCVIIGNPSAVARTPEFATTVEVPLIRE